MLDADAVSELARVPLAKLKAWAPTWHDLPSDNYLKDGGRYRRRRHASFIIESPGGTRIVTDYAGYSGGILPDAVTMNRAHTSHFTDAPDPAIEHVLRGWKLLGRSRTGVPLVSGRPVPNGNGSDELPQLPCRLLLPVRRDDDQRLSCGPILGRLGGSLHSLFWRPVPVGCGDDVLHGVPSGKRKAACTLKEMIHLASCTH